MFIKEIVIDGFKSYAHRTEVQGFDPHFNAITGLNGSGKSNILDSICFVLGIKNLSQVRAGNLSELVYKQGQAGVNRAMVTIVFNNEDKDNSPVGYQDSEQLTVTRQVLLGGKSKYLINGKTVSATQVQNLFHSVQLNVDNPHFLIMQGRITKVLNMKSHEILGMVEEAAGTRMYETKRVAALKTIEKKQAKLDELNSVLSEEITPTLERLRGEKQSYLQWSKNNADIERLERFVVASEFTKATKAVKAESHDSEKMEEKVTELEALATEKKEAVKAKQAEISERSSRLEGEFADQHKKAKDTEKKCSNALVKISSTWQNSKDTVAKAESDLESAQSLLDETKASVVDKEKQIAKDSGSIERRQEEAMAAEKKLEQLTSDYQNMSAGINTSDGEEGGTLPEQIAKAHSDSKTAEARIEQAQTKIRYLSKELKTVEKDLKKEAKSAENLAAQRDKATKKVDDIKAKIASLNFSEDEFNKLDQEKMDLEASVAELSECVDTLTAKLEGKLAFHYSDPVRGFDRSKVKGAVAKLVTVLNPKHSTALEVVAGGKLYQIVVDEAITGKALLDRGKLKNRVTLIPLDQIKSRQVSHNVCKQASSMAESMRTTAKPAIELVGFDEEVRLAMEFVFGTSIVVDGTKAANKICDATKTRTVSMEGDVYDPNGTISGGSKNKLGDLLSGLSELRNATTSFQEKAARLRKLMEKLNPMMSVASKFEKFSAELELAEAALASTAKNMSQTTYGILVEKRDTMVKELEAAEQECIDMQQEQEEKWTLYEDLQTQKEELTQKREERLAEIEGAVKKAKVEVAKKAKLAQEAESQSQTLGLELDSLQTEVEAAKDAVHAAENALKEAIDEEAELQMKVGDARASYDDAKQLLDDLEQKMSTCSAELVTLHRERSDLNKAAEDATLEAKKLSVAIERMRKERAGAEKVVSNMLKKYAWIDSEKSAFGIEGGDYDFEANNPDQADKELRKLKSETESLAKKINKKVMGMIEKAEGEYTELLRKRKVVENDKKKIQAVIEELDLKKKSELERTWVKVNRDFGSIFSTLLPGASAKLEPPEGMEAWEGLEVKVAFGDVWKESLSELSGGQRSLLALSLILSLLLFKPAPMYILDEVDAALDLSHTQNIGNMLKTHFSQSQFVVVSLKEGMFNNANVIFRTKFVDGVSTVTRTIGTGSSERARALAEAENLDEDYSSSRKLSSARPSRRKGKENAA